VSSINSREKKFNESSKSMWLENLVMIISALKIKIVPIHDRQQCHLCGKEEKEDTKKDCF
jgi:hypothetical protein